MADGNFPSEALYSVYHQYTIMVEGRDAVQARLKAAGVATMVYYPVPLHLQEVHANLGLQSGAYPHAEYAAEHCLSLPIFPEMTSEQREQVISALAQSVQLVAT